MIPGVVPVCEKGMMRGCLSCLGWGVCGMPRVPPASLGMGQCQALPLALKGVGNDTEVSLVNRGMEMSEFSLSSSSLGCFLPTTLSPSAKSRV